MYFKKIERNSSFLPIINYYVRLTSTSTDRLLKAEVNFSLRYNKKSRPKAARLINSKASGDSADV